MSLILKNVSKGNDLIITVDNFAKDYQKLIEDAKKDNKWNNKYCYRWNNYRNKKIYRI